MPEEGGYESLAQVYDLLMDDFDYDAWARHYLTLLGPARDACELACGTGSLTVRFARSGLRMTGIHRSRAMLRQAGEKCRQWGVSVPLICQDMRGFALTRRTGAVLCTCDGVNYLLEEEDLSSFLRSCRRALREGGTLLFDVSTPYKLETVTGERFFGEERDGIATLWQNRLDRARSRITMDLTVFVREQDGRYRRFRETHRQRWWQREELEAALRAAGFTQIGFFGDYTLEAPKEESLRWHVRARAGEE